MKRNRNYLKSIFTIVFYTIGFLFCFSCVYFNTFYNAETSFEDAEKIIDESPLLEAGEIPPQAKKLLGESIDNCNIVLEKYPTSKYVDDAFYIISKARFLRNEYALSVRYIDRLIGEYPQSEFVQESKILRAYAHFRIGLIDSTQNQLDAIELLPKLTRKEKFLLQNLKAELHLSNNNIEEALSLYESAIKSTKKVSNKVGLYLKLVKICEENKNFDKVIAYLDELLVIAPFEIKKSTVLDWIAYNRKIGNYDSIITKMDELLGQSDFSIIHIKLSLEKAKVYMDLKDLETAKLLFSEFTATYERKAETAEAYYHLGYIALMEDFDLALAKEYFDDSKKAESNSEYGKKSKEMKVVIDDFTALQEEYEYKRDNPEDFEAEEEIEEDNTLERFDTMRMPSPRNSVEATPDSILFTIAEKLLFDFNHEEEALLKFKEVIAEFPESKFVPQSLFVLSNYEPNEAWKTRLETDFPESTFNSDVDDTQIKNSISAKRDDIWKNLSDSYENASSSFYQLFENEQDTLSLYYCAFIQDHYLNELKLALENYMLFHAFEFDKEFTNLAKFRIDEINDGVSTEVELLEQKLNYKLAFDRFIVGEPFDSVDTAIEAVLQGKHSQYRKSAQKLKSSLQKLDLFRNLLIPDSTGILDTNIVQKLDSIYYHIGDIFDYSLGLEDSATHYYEYVVNNYNESKFGVSALESLCYLDSQSKFSNMLLDAFPDSTFVMDSTRVKTEFIDEILLSNFQQENEEKLALMEEIQLLINPPEIDTSMVDSTEQMIIEMPVDTTNAIIDSLGNIPTVIDSTHKDLYEEGKH